MTSTTLDCTGTPYDAMRAKLDADQTAAHDLIVYGDTDLRVAAGAGSGKTRLLITSVTGLITEGRYPADAVVLVAYTRSASDEMKRRIADLLGWGAVKAMPVGTFHSLALRALTAADAPLDMVRCLDLPPKSRDTDLPSAAWLWRQIVTGYKQIDGLQEEGLNLEDKLERLGLTSGHYATRVNILRGRMIERGTAAGREAAAQVRLPQFGEAWRLYELAKKALGAWDFTDALVRWHHMLLRGQGVQPAIVLVDEAQDINPLQHDIARLLAHGEHRTEPGRLVLVGDSRQAIMGFQGALADTFINWTGPSCALATNYRSAQTVVGAGNAIAAGQSWHIGGDMHALPRALPGLIRVLGDAPSPSAAAGMAAKEVADSIEEGAHAGDFAVLLRTNSLVGLYEAAFLQAGVPCATLRGKSFFLRAGSLDFLAYAHLHRSDSIPALRRIVNTPKRYLGRAFADHVERLARGSLPRAIGHAAREVRSAGSRRNAEALAEWLVAFRALPWRAEAADQPGAEGPCKGSRTAPEAILRLLSPTEKELEEAGADGVREWEQGRGGDFVACRAIGERYATSEEFLVFARACAGATAEFGVKGSDRTARVTLGTGHTAKGLEWRHVYSDWSDGVLPHIRAVKPDEQDEERRLAYVIATRAIETLTVVWAEEDIFGRAAGEGPFIRLINDGGGDAE